MTPCGVEKFNISAPAGAATKRPLRHVSSASRRDRTKLCDRIWIPVLTPALGVIVIATKRSRKRNDLSIRVIIAPAPWAHRTFDKRAVRRRNEGMALKAHLAFGMIAFDIAGNFLAGFE